MTVSKLHFVDTNIFLRALVREDERSFRSCVLFLSKIKEGKIKAVSSALVFAEINWVLSKHYKFSKEETIRALDGILNLKNLKINILHDLSKALNIYKAHNVKFIDAVIASSTGLHKSLTIVSYDRDFDKIGIKRLEPDSFV